MSRQAGAVNLPLPALLTGLDLLPVRNIGERAFARCHKQPFHLSKTDRPASGPFLLFLTGHFLQQIRDVLSIDEELQDFAGLAQRPGGLPVDLEIHATGIPEHNLKTFHSIK